MLEGKEKKIHRVSKLGSNMICSSTWFTSWGVWKMRKMLLDQVSIDQIAKAQLQISAMEAANSWAVFASSVKILWSPWEGRYFNKWKDRFYTGSTPLFSAPFISRLTYSSGFRVEMTGPTNGFHLYWSTHFPEFQGHNLSMISEWHVKI